MKLNNIDEAIELANEIKSGRCRSYVLAAQAFADFVLELKAAQEENKRFLDGLKELQNADYHQ